MRTSKLLIISATITLLGAVVSCNKKSLQEENIITPDHTYEYGVDHDAGGITRNTAFEYDWASQNKIELVTSYKKENDRIKVETIDVPLPWAWQSGPQQWLPQYAARNMSERDAAYWHLVFNLTGVDEKPGEHFFGLYNSKTGILRVFYYLTADRIPAHDGNDHMWQMGFTQDLVEHVAFQFALPYGEPVTDFYKRALGGNAAAYKTTALTEACSKQGKVVPAIGWWCYEVDMSPLREHNFFESDRSVMTPGMLVFHEDNVVLNSIMQGSLDGKMTGSINLESLAGAGTSTGGAILGGLLGGVGGFLTNCTWLDKAKFDYGSTVGLIIAGLTVGFAGEATKDLWTSSPETSGLGDMDCDIKLSLCASIASIGAIGGARTSLVPSPDLDVKTYFKRKTLNGKATGFGEGIWNIEHHPVIYVVKDAFWSDKPEFSCAETREVNGRKAYHLTLDPDKFGIRLISFMDPGSIGGIKINPNVLPQQVTSLQVAATHGILGWGTNGYTNNFRSAIGLDYTVPDLSPKEGGFQSSDADAGFKLIHMNHDDAIFKQTIPEDEKDFAAYRLSQYSVSGNIHRRMYGLSTYYTNKNAGPNEIDNVSAVAEPQVFLPADSDNRFLFGPESPDFVVTAMLRVEGIQEDGEDHVLVHSLRYVPQIKYVSLSELPGIYSTIVSNAAALKAAHPDIAFPEMDAQLARIKVLIDNAK